MTDERPAPRGRLRVLAGMTEGVGTTSRLLDEGRRLRAAGVDVVVGVVAMHGRPGVERLLEGLEIVDGLSVSYRGVTIEELDPRAVIERRPAVALVDELWHENAPGLGRLARWGDVNEIRAAGIDVISTLDLGRLESLADAVETITGSPILERLPDTVLDDADEVVLVDVSGVSLRRRIADGEVYPADQARGALDRYVTEPNLLTLRELAFRYMAQRAERELERAGSTEAGPGPLAGPVLVFVEAGPDGRHAVRRAAILASLLRVSLVALAPDAGARGWPNRPALAPSARENLDYAIDLGAERAPIAGRDLVAAIAKTARERRSTHLVLRRRAPSGWARLWARPLLDRILHANPDLEVHLVAGPAITPTLVEAW